MLSRTKNTKKMRKEAEKQAATLRKQAKELRSQAKDVAKDAKLEERAADLAEQVGELAQRIRESDAMAKAQATGEELIEKAREQISDAHLDERAAELAERVRDSDQYKQAMATAGEATDKTLARVGDWISHGPAADKLGVKPKSKKRTFSKWMLAGMGVVAGFAAGVVTGARKHETVEELERVAGRVAQDTADIGAPPAQKPIADEVRTRLGEDPRTSGLPRLNINVAENTVFVRGSVPESIDQEAIRSVISTVPGVEDIDLQLTTAQAEGGSGSEGETEDA